MACSNWTQLLPRVSPPPDQVEEQWWSAVPAWRGQLGVGEVMNNTTTVLKGCMTVVALSLILRYVVHSWTKLNGIGGGGKLHCHWKRSTFRVRGTVDGGGTGLVTTFVVVIPLLLVIAGDVEVNPGPPKMEGTVIMWKISVAFQLFKLLVCCTYNHWLLHVNVTRIFHRYSTDLKSCHECTVFSV